MEISYTIGWIICNIDREISHQLLKEMIGFRIKFHRVGLKEGAFGTVAIGMVSVHLWSILVGFDYGFTFY